MSEPEVVQEKKINVSITSEAHRNLTVLCAAWLMTQGEVLSRVLEEFDIADAVEQLR